jgi:dihydroorotate dehydrogenase
LLNIQFPNALIKNNRPKLLIRYDTKLNNDEIKQYVNICKKVGIIDGFVVGGMTTLKDKAGCYVAGDNNREESLKLLKKFYELTKGEFALISTGGVLNGNDVYERIQNGADFVLIYSPFIINGPFCLEKIIKELEEKMKKEGKKTIDSIRI